MLRRQTDAARALGFGTFAASELEHYLFRTSYAAMSRGALRDLTPAGWYLEDYHLMQGARTEDFHGAVRRHLKDSGVPVENSKGEWGRGQHEVNVRYADTLVMADRHVVFKQCMKELADSMGVSVTFMAKIASNQAGSGCHIHFSLWRKKRNAFVGNKTLGPIKCSDEFRWFLGGWIARVPEVMVFYAPDGQLVQALRRRLLGTDASRVEPRQPHRGIQSRRRRRRAPHRMPSRGRGLQSVPGVRGVAGLGTGRHRQSHRAAGPLQR